MSLGNSTRPKVSAVFFGPQSKAPDGRILSATHAFLSGHEYGSRLLRAVAHLDEDWTELSSSANDLRFSNQIHSHIRNLSAWASGTSSNDVSKERSAAVVLPLVLIIQLSQYLQYLETINTSHAALRGEASALGGFQGLCEGLAAALTTAYSEDVAAVIENGIVFMRLLMLIGAQAELADQMMGTKSSVSAIQFEDELEITHILRDFPEVRRISNCPKSRKLLNHSAFGFSFMLQL